VTNPWKSILAAGALSLAATVSRAVPAASDRGTTEPPSLASAHAPGVGAEIQAQEDDTDSGDGTESDGDDDDDSRES